MIKPFEIQPETNQNSNCMLQKQPSNYFKDKNKKDNDNNITIL